MVFIFGKWGNLSFRFPVFEENMFRGVQLRRVTLLIIPNLNSIKIEDNFGRNIIRGSSCVCLIK
jgi:hypothetical protein